jgi:hypothetical protein
MTIRRKVTPLQRARVIDCALNNARYLVELASDDDAARLKRSSKVDAGRVKKRVKSRSKPRFLIQSDRKGSQSLALRQSFPGLDQLLEFPGLFRDAIGSPRLVARSGLRGGLLEQLTDVVPQYCDPIIELGSRKCVCHRDLLIRLSRRLDHPGTGPRRRGFQSSGHASISSGDEFWLFGLPHGQTH